MHCLQWPENSKCARHIDTAVAWISQRAARGSWGTVRPYYCSQDPKSQRRYRQTLSLFAMTSSSMDHKVRNYGSSTIYEVSVKCCPMLQFISWCNMQSNVPMHSCMVLSTIISFWPWSSCWIAYRWSNQNLLKNFLECSTSQLHQVNDTIMNIIATANASTAGEAVLSL